MKIKIKKKTNIPIEAECISTAVIDGLNKSQILDLEIIEGNRKIPLKEFFTVTDDKSDVLTVEGDLSVVKYLGAKMKSGKMIINGNTGMHIGSEMSGGTIEVNGDIGDWAAPQMSGGVIKVSGDGGHCIACAYRGASKGVKGGVIIIEGSVKNEIGHGMSNALIIVKGNVGDFAGVNMNSGTIIICGETGIRTGAGMKRGTIISLNEIKLLPGFTYDCEYSPSFFSLLFRNLKDKGFLNMQSKYINGNYRRYSGDAVELNKGEIFIFDS